MKNLFIKISAIKLFVIALLFALASCEGKQEKPITVNVVTDHFVVQSIDTYKCDVGYARFKTESTDGKTVVYFIDGQDKHKIGDYIPFGYTETKDTTQIKEFEF